MSSAAKPESAINHMRLDMSTSPDDRACEWEPIVHAGTGNDPQMEQCLVHDHTQTALGIVQSDDHPTADIGDLRFSMRGRRKILTSDPEGKLDS